MQINVGSQGKYSAIKAILFGAMTMFIGPAVMGAVMNAMTEGDTTRYLMAIGLLLVGVGLIVIYVFLSHEEAKEESEPEITLHTGPAGTKDEPTEDDEPVEKSKEEE